MTKQVLQQALTALQFVATGVKVTDPPQSVITDTIEALREALAQQGEQQPVAWVERDGELVWNNREAAIGRNLYIRQAAPAAQPDTWTDDGGWTFPIEGGRQ